MKTLRESLFDQDTDINQDELDEAVITKWIKDNYKIVKYKINLTDKKVIPDSNVIVTNRDIEQLLPEGWSFDIIKGDFICRQCSKLVSLEGSPERVIGSFDCSRCSSLKTLEGGPRSTGGMFTCSHCTSLESLEGAPELKSRVGYFECSHCNSLKNLKGAPDYIPGSFYCGDCASLKSLEGAPKKVLSIFDCSHCPKLTSLDFLPSLIGGDLYCSGCNIKKYSILSKSDIVGEIYK